VTASARLAPIDRNRLNALIDKGKSDPTQVRTLKCRTVTEARFRQLNFIRTLPAHAIDEPPQLLGDDTAPNPSEALLAALGSCIAVGIHANAVAQGITLSSIELDLEADLNVTSVWGTGDTAPKPVGFTAVRVRAKLDGDTDRETLSRMLAHAVKWSPVTGTIRNPVPVDVHLV
jgi:uncharacterized OsmC-like protein